MVGSQTQSCRLVQCPDPPSSIMLQELKSGRGHLKLPERQPLHVLSVHVFLSGQLLHPLAHALHPLLVRISTASPRGATPPSSALAWVCKEPAGRPLAEGGGPQLAQGAPDSRTLDFSSQLHRDVRLQESLDIGVPGEANGVCCVFAYNAGFFDAGSTSVGSAGGWWILPLLGSMR